LIYPQLASRPKKYKNKVNKSQPSLKKKVQIPRPVLMVTKLQAFLIESNYHSIRLKLKKKEKAPLSKSSIFRRVRKLKVSKKTIDLTDLILLDRTKRKTTSSKVDRKSSQEKMMLRKSSKMTVTVNVLFKGQFKVI
jgi:hypothetical protein